MSRAEPAVKAAEPIEPGKKKALIRQLGGK